MPDSDLTEEIEGDGLFGCTLSQETAAVQFRRVAQWRMYA